MMFGDEAFDLALPDFYMNLLVPLDPITNTNGTEFLLGSHKCTQDKLASCQNATAVMQPGDIVFFNGKIVHRGRASDTMRSVVYVVFAAPWYEADRSDRGPEFAIWKSGKPYDS